MMRIHRASLNLQVTCQEEIEQINLVVVDKLSRQLKKAVWEEGRKLCGSRMKIPEKFN